MAASLLLLGGLPILRLRLHQHNRIAACILTRQPWSIAAESTRAVEEVPYVDPGTGSLSVRDPRKHRRWEDAVYWKWKDKEKEILRDIEPIFLLTKEILHSDRYADGECLSDEDEKAVVEKLLAYHPHSEDKIGCGLHCIMVDRHPQHTSRCLFVVRTDGAWIDFSYQKCLRAYLQLKYPYHARKFIYQHLKRRSAELSGPDGTSRI